MLPPILCTQGVSHADQLAQLLHKVIGYLLCICAHSKLPGSASLLVTYLEVDKLVGIWVTATA